MKKSEQEKVMITTVEEDQKNWDKKVASLEELKEEFRKKRKKRELENKTKFSVRFE